MASPTAAATSSVGLGSAGSPVINTPAIIMESTTIYLPTHPTTYVYPSPYNLTKDITRTSSVDRLGMNSHIALGFRVIGFVILLLAAGFTLLCIVGLVASYRRQRLVFGGKEKAVLAVAAAAAEPYHDSAAGGGDVEAGAKRRAAGFPFPSSMPLPPPVPPTLPSGLLALGVIFLGLVFKIAMACVSFVATDLLDVRGMASPLSRHAEFLAELEDRWRLLRGQAFLEYGSVALFLAGMVATARHFPSAAGTKWASVAGRAADAVVCLAGFGLWFATWATILGDVRPDPEFPRFFWTLVLAARRPAELHVALMIWAFFASVYVCGVLVTKLVLAHRRPESVHAVHRVILATFASFAVPSILGVAVVYACWGAAGNVDDWAERPSEAQLKTLRLIFMCLSQPGEVLMMSLAAWSVKRLYLLRSAL